MSSKLQLARLTVEWKSVELWTLSAERFLAEGDVGIVPWIPLMQFDGLPEALLERCVEKIERMAHPKDRADLMTVSQVMAELRFPNPELLRLLGGQETMIESPLIQKLIAGRVQDLILDALKDRFGTVPRDITKLLREIIDEKKLRQLNRLANRCSDMEAFRNALLS